MADRIVIKGAREHNLKDIDRRDSARPPGRHHRALRLGQVVARLRHDLRRGAAPLRRVAVGLCAPVPGADGEAGRRFDRGPVAGHLHRAEDHRARTRARPSARSPRSTITCGCCSRASARRTATTAGARSRAQTVQQIVDQLMKLPAGHAPPRAGADRARPQGRVPQGAGRSAQGRLRARPHRRHAARAGRGHRADKNIKHTIEVIVDRLVIRDGHREAPGRLAGGRLQVRRRGAQGRSARRRPATATDEILFSQKLRLRGVRHLLSGDHAADVLLQQSARRVPDLQRARHVDVLRSRS